MQKKNRPIQYLYKAAFLLLFFITIFPLAASPLKQIAHTIVLQQKTIGFVEITPKSINLPSTGGTFTITVSSDINWSVLPCNQCAVNPISGTGNQVITIVSPPNYSIFNLSSSVAVFSGKSSSECIINIAAHPADIQFSNTDILFGPEKDQVFPLGFFTNTSCEMSGLPSWLDHYQSEYEIGLVTKEPNMTTDPRIATLVFSLPDGKKKYISITQAAINFQNILSLDIAVKNFDSNGGTGIIKIQSNTSWRLNNPHNWIETTVSGGFGNMLVPFKIALNPLATGRSAQITILDSKRESNAAIVQQYGAPVSFKASSVKIILNSVSGASFPLIIETNTLWNIKSKPSWIEIMPIASYDNFINIAIVSNSSNNLATLREGEIELESETGEMVKLNITQAGTDFDQNILLNTNDLIKDPPGNTTNLQIGQEYIPHLQQILDTLLEESLFSLRVNANTDWNINPESDWIEPAKKVNTSIKPAHLKPKNNPNEKHHAAARIKTGKLSKDLKIVHSIPDALNTLEPQIGENEVFAVYPNPAQGSFNVYTKFHAPVISVYNLIGQEVKRVTLPDNKRSVQISGLEKGLYFVYVLSNDKKFLKKVTVE